MQSRYQKIHVGGEAFLANEFFHVEFFGTCENFMLNFFYQRQMKMQIKLLHHVRKGKTIKTHERFNEEYEHQFPVDGMYTSNTSHHF